jgi:hypothetical protein
MWFVWLPVPTWNSKSLSWAAGLLLALLVSWPALCTPTLVVHSGWPQTPGSTWQNKSEPLAPCPVPIRTGTDPCGAWWSLGISHSRHSCLACCLCHSTPPLDVRRISAGRASPPTEWARAHHSESTGKEMFGKNYNPQQIQQQTSTSPRLVLPSGYLGICRRNGKTTQKL